MRTIDCRTSIVGYRARAREQGWDLDHIKFMAGATVIVGRTDDEVARKVETGSTGCAAWTAT